MSHLSFLLLIGLEGTMIYYKLALVPLASLARDRHRPYRGCRLSDL